MQQLEIQYFFPLTEQIPLDLDYKPCRDFEEERRKQWAASSVTSISGMGLVANGGIGATWSTINTTPTCQFKPNPDAVGYWAINKDLQIWRKQRPNWLHQKMTKVFFGWEWNDK